MRNTENKSLATYVPSAMEVVEDNAPDSVHPIKQVHSLLRGRYLLAVTLALVGMCAGAFVGYRMQEPMYESVGMIRIKPHLPRILYQTEQSAMLPMFSAFVESQVALIRSQRVIDLAMEHPDWKARGRGRSPEQVAAFAGSLTVAHPRGTELIMVTFADKEPDAAQTAVRAVIEAYQTFYGDTESGNLQHTMDHLLDRQTSLSDEYKKLEEQINSIGGGIMSAGAMPLVYNAKLQRLAELETQLQQAELSVAMALRPPAEEGDNQPPPTVSPELIALRVPEVARLLAARRELEWQISIDLRHLGEQHRHVVDRRDRLDFLNAQIEEVSRRYYQIFQEGGARGIPLVGDKDIDQLRADEATVRALYDQVKSEAEALGRKVVQIDKLRVEANLVRSRLEETRRRIDQLDTERGVGGRISIITHGDRPLGAAKDRRKVFAAAGSVGLGGIGVALVLLLGLVDRRVRHISDVQTDVARGHRVLGVLPMLPLEDSDPEQVMMAAHSVHRIRMLLQPREPGHKSVIAITSASPGAGKTSLTLALGLSFAASGAKTLMIDCDMIGGGLTARLKKVTRRRLGHILRRLGLINTPQLIAALKESRRTTEPIGQTLVRQGLVTQADVDQALELQHDALVGLREALTGDPANECVTDAGSPGLYLMPLGSAQQRHAAQLSYAALRKVLDQVRSWFDVVLIDTGPMLGSLEASVVAMAADQVVLTVARGEQRPLISKALEHLQASGGRLGGVVLNRAEASDIQASGFSSSISHVSVRSSESIITPVGASSEHKCLQLGPLGEAVASLGEPSDQLQATS